MRVPSYRIFAALGTVCWLLAACQNTPSMPGWMKGDFGGDSDDEEVTGRLPGERYAVLSTAGTAVQVDASLSNVPVSLPSVLRNVSWPQRGGNASNAVGALEIMGWKEADSAEIGKGNKVAGPVVATPVMADGVVYAMDGKGYVSAHEVANIRQVRWVSNAAVNQDDEDVMGGGLAVAGAQLFVTTGHGEVICLNTQDGSVIWRRALGAPVRSAPKLQQGMLYAATVDDRVLAIDSGAGTIAWQHRGLGAQVGFLSVNAPAIGDNFVIAGYSSGELYGLAADNGQEIWSDSLSLPHKTSATAVFTGFDGDPIIAGGVTFAAASNGMLVATHLLTGRRVWEQEISSAGTPWLAGNFLFAVTSDAKVVAVHARDGRVKWVHDLPRYGDPEDQKEPYRWFGPMMLGSYLAVVGAHGEAHLLNPADGVLVRVVEVPDGIAHAPVVADGTMYLATQSATLYTLRGE